jgi:hypothetical protein
MGDIITMKTLLITSALLLFTSCSTTSKLDTELEKQIKMEKPNESSEKTKEDLLGIINDDASITPIEKEKLIELINEGFDKNREFDILINQKKTFLVREYAKTFPNISIINKVKKEIRRSYKSKTDYIVSIFEKMTEIMVKHPKSVDRFIERYNRDNYFDRNP